MVNFSEAVSSLTFVAEPLLWVGKGSHVSSQEEFIGGNFFHHFHSAPKTLFHFHHFHSSPKLKSLKGKKAKKEKELKKKKGQELKKRRAKQEKSKKGNELKRKTAKQEKSKKGNELKKDMNRWAEMTR